MERKAAFLLACLLVTASVEPNPLPPLDRARFCVVEVFAVVLTASRLQTSSCLFWVLHLAPPCPRTSRSDGPRRSEALMMLLRTESVSASLGCCRGRVVWRACQDGLSRSLWCFGGCILPLLKVRAAGRPLGNGEARPPGPKGQRRRPPKHLRSHHPTRRKKTQRKQRQGRTF